VRSWGVPPFRVYYQRRPRTVDRGAFELDSAMMAGIFAEALKEFHHVFGAAE